MKDSCKKHTQENIILREKRRSGRSEVNQLKGSVFHNGKTYSCVIENISSHGLFLITASKETLPCFVPEEKFDVEFMTPEMVNMKLGCEMRWVHINKTPVLGFIYRMGVEVYQIYHSRRADTGL